MSISDIAGALLWVYPGGIGLIFVGGLFYGLQESGRAWAKVELDSFRLTRLRTLLTAMLGKGQDGATIICAQPHSSRYVEFQLAERQSHEGAIELCFPDCEWSQAYFPELETYCRRNNIEHRIEHHPFSTGGRTLFANCKRDAEHAYTLADAIWTRVFRLDSEATCTFECKGFVEPAVEAPNLEPCKLHPNTQKWQSGTAYLVGGLLMGLCIVTALSVGGVPDWHIKISGVTLAGSYASLTLFCLSFATSLFVWGLSLSRRWPKAADWGFSKTAYWLGALIEPAIYLAVVTVWMGI